MPSMKETIYGAAPPPLFRNNALKEKRGGRSVFTGVTLFVLDGW